MATLYVWSASIIEKSFGHTSLYLHDTHDYISWWPTDSKEKLKLTSKKAKILQRLPKTYHEEIEEFMLRQADHTFHIKEFCIDCDKMIHKWQSITGDEGYHLFSKNCSTVIIDVLNSGMVCSKFRPKPGFTDVFTPNDVKEYGQKLQTLKIRKETNCCLAERLTLLVHGFKYGCNCNCRFREELCDDRTLWCYFKCCMCITCFSCVCLCEKILPLFDKLYRKVSSCCECNFSVKHNKYEEIYDV